MEQAHTQDTSGEPLKELRFNARDPLLKDSLMLLEAQGTKKVFQTIFEQRNAYLFSQRKLYLDTSDKVYYDEAHGESINASVFGRYENLIQKISDYGIRAFKLDAELELRPVLGIQNSTRYVDLSVHLPIGYVDGILSPPLYGPLNHSLPISDETAARDKRENEERARMIESGKLPVAFEVERMVEDDGEALARLGRVLKLGAAVSQLEVVSTRTAKSYVQSRRYMTKYTTRKIERPYQDVRDIDEYIRDLEAKTSRDVSV